MIGWARVSTIVVRIASPHRSAQCMGAPISVGSGCAGGVGDRPDEAGEFAHHGHADLVVVYASGAKTRVTAGQPQLCHPGDRLDWLSQVLLARHACAARPMRGVNR